jgi:hypothetical protein
MTLGKNMRSALLLVVMLCGCAHPAIRTDEVSRLAGTYQNGDGFWPRWIELNADGTFSYSQITDNLKQASDGAFVFEGGWGLSGKWTFHRPDKIELSANGRPEKITVFVRRSTKYEFVILEPDLFPDILSRWRDDGSWGYLKKQKPNKAPEPTA